jgi:hypothetical protein
MGDKQPAKTIKTNNLNPLKTIFSKPNSMPNSMEEEETQKPTKARSKP